MRKWKSIFWELFSENNPENNFIFKREKKMKRKRTKYKTHKKLPYSSQIIKCHRMKSGILSDNLFLQKLLWKYETGRVKALRSVCVGIKHCASTACHSNTLCVASTKRRKRHVGFSWKAAKGEAVRIHNQLKVALFTLRHSEIQLVFLYIYIYNMYISPWRGGKY